jgi:hypothetical protein
MEGRGEELSLLGGLYWDKRFQNGTQRVQAPVPQGGGTHGMSVAEEVSSPVCGKRPQFFFFLWISTPFISGSRAHALFWGSVNRRNWVDCSNSPFQTNRPDEFVRLHGVGLSFS